ncbi:hypothetical protein HDV57DRAFT_283710 [Trichoderma longibrachiatum]|uniref:Uncharacterized protein n=1 Tax=Trichoderma longibrachiatum ATCC 18648 TaxID=983965 RepID=A0A2T4CDM6_TRILO|nr:hypothetical protein M440DRAFT_243333 [Trichoderma longibrachiatum ATCC 18648]
MSRLRTGKVPRIRHIRVQHVRACMYPSASKAEPEERSEGLKTRPLRVEDELSWGFPASPALRDQYLATGSFDLSSPGRRFHPLQHEAKAARPFCVQCYPVVALHRCVVAHTRAGRRAEIPEMVEGRRSRCWSSCGNGSVERRRRIGLPVCLIMRVTPGYHFVP